MHAERRRRILREHPNVAALQGPEEASKWIALALVVTQIGIACVVQYMNVYVYVCVLYLAGVTLTHALFLAVHELSHNLFLTETCTTRSSPSW